MESKNFDNYVSRLLSEMEETETHKCECGCEDCGGDCPCDKNCECKGEDI
jgi:hypothetical protein